MTDREKLARQWAEDYQKNYPEFLPETHAAELVEKAKAAAEYIMEHTSPPTMADVEWNKSVHNMAGADWDGHSPVVMIEEDYCDTIVAISDDGVAVNVPDKKDLTPNGKRYELREKPDHPEVLTTVEDYENAPSGTIVAVRHCGPSTKNEESNWSTVFSTGNSAEKMAGIERWVLRWGWGDVGADTVEFRVVRRLVGDPEVVE